MAYAEQRGEGKQDYLLIKSKKAPALGVGFGTSCVER
jgi:hypothetical protein